MKQIDTLLWSFLWNFKQPVVARTTMLQNTATGGVNMTTLHYSLICKQIKLIYKIISSENAHWNLIGKHWLQKFDIEYCEAFFLCKCSNIKGLNISEMPYFYQRGITSWSCFMSNFEKSSKQQILNEHLFGNINISVRNTPMFYSDFSRCNIKTVSDIWNIRNNTFHDEQYIHNQTTETHNWRQKYNKLKRNTPERWVDILRSYDNQTHIKPMLEINTELILFMNGKNIETNKLSSKRIINHLIDDVYKPKCQTKWEAMYN